MGKEADNFAGAEKLVFLETFGCQMNENDSARILGALRAINYSTTNDPVSADLIILNTCSVRDRAEHKVYSALGKFKDLKDKNPGLIIGVAGCVAQDKGTTLLKRIKHLDLVFGPNNIHRLKAMVLGAIGGKRLASIEQTDEIASEEYGYVPDRASVKASVSIMRGCDNFCTYCIVPYTRGREASRASADVIDEVKRLAENGVKEVTLLGQNVNSYGKGGSTEASFPALLSMVCAVDGIERVRFLTSHPKDISDELIRLFDNEEKLCRHVHLPVQSGSDNILKAMGRGYTGSEYLKKADTLRRLYPDMSITTDIITGFPGETDRDFEDTLSLIRRARFDNSFAFMYSPRPHTAAEALKGRIPDEIKSSRLHAVQELQREIAFENNKLLVGRTVSVLVEGRSKADPEEMSGRTSCNRIVNLSLPNNKAGRIIDILINKAYPNSLRGIHEKRSGLC